jgi:hypothetical protein
MENYNEKWSINECLLQSYRQIFVGFQSFLLAGGALVVEKSPYIFYPIAVLSIISIFYIWMPVVIS